MVKVFNSLSWNVKPLCFQNEYVENDVATYSFFEFAGGTARLFSRGREKCLSDPKMAGIGWQCFNPI